jgi:hypothetical protein
MAQETASIELLARPPLRLTFLATEELDGGEVVLDLGDEPAGHRLGLVRSCLAHATDAIGAAWG